MAEGTSIQKKGKFSLIELLMIIMLVGIVFTLIIPLRNDRLNKEKLKEAIKNVQIIARANVIFKNDPEKGDGTYMFEHTVVKYIEPAKDESNNILPAKETGEDLLNIKDKLEKSGDFFMFDYFVTDPQGNITIPFETGSCYHVLWKTTQRVNTTEDGALLSTTFTANTSSPTYDTNYTEKTIELFGEWERLPIADVPLQPGAYTAQLVLTEESFHGDGEQYVGNWAAAMTTSISFIIENN